MRNYEIQNLRAIAMICVLIGHMPIVLPNILLHGYTFVSLFLVISGYFAAVQFKRKYSETTGSFKIIRNEMINKMFRLFPLMWIWILIYFIVANLFIYLGGQYGDMDRWYGELKSALLLYYNYYLARLDIGGLFGQYWTLFVEIHFFLIFILLFVLFRKKKSRIVLSAAMVIITIFVFRPLTPLKEIRYATLAQLDSLFCGVLIGLCCEEKKYLKKYNINKLVKKSIGLVLCVTLFLLGWYFDTYMNNPFIKYTVYTVLASIILFLARENDGWFSYGEKTNLFLRWCGDASASTYVSHVIIYSCIYYNLYYNTNIIPEIIKNTWWGICIQVVLLILVACCVGRISYKLIELPYGNYGKMLLSKAKK